MTAPRAWRTLARRDLIRDRWLHVEALHVVTGRGVELDPYYLIRERDWACALPVLPDGRLVLVAQYRPGADGVTLELPAGDIDPGEDPTAAVQRELAEETGYHARGPVVPLPPLQPDPSRNVVTGHGFVVPVGDLPTAPAPEAGEDIALELATPAAVDAALADGRFRHAAHVAWLLLARARGLVPAADG